MTTVVQVHGLSHSGSTILGLMLGKHPNVFNVGEWINYCTEYFSQWRVPILLRRRFNAVFGASGDRYAPHCSVCGESCPVFPGVENSLILPLDDHYEVLSEHLKKFKPDVRVIIDTSKWPAFHKVMRDHSSTTKFVKMVTYKDPVGFVESMAKLARRSGYDDIKTDWAIVKVVEWCMYYEALDCEASVLYSDLAKTPGPVLSKLLGELGLDPVDGLEEYWTEAPHQIAGNPGAHVNLRHSQKHIGRDNQLYIDEVGITGVQYNPPSTEASDLVDMALYLDPALDLRVERVLERLKG